MFYRDFKSPAIVKTGNHIIEQMDEILHSAHLFFPSKILVTQKELKDIYGSRLNACGFKDEILVHGGSIEEAPILREQIGQHPDALVVAFGGGSVLDLVKYCASKSDRPYITMPSALSNDAVYSCVSRLSANGKKTSYGVQPPMGIIVDFDVVRQSPKKLLLAGVADIVSNLSACQDWLLAYNNIGETINEIAFMLAKQAAYPLFDYVESDLTSNRFLFDLTNGIITSGLSMIISGNTRGTSGAEHLISHAIDEYFPERSTIHGLQVGWAHRYIQNHYRDDERESNRINHFFDSIGLSDVIDQYVGWEDADFETLIPYALEIRNRYTVFNTVKGLS